MATTAGASQPTHHHNDRKRKLSAINNTPSNSSQPSQRAPNPKNNVKTPLKNTTKTSAPPPRPSVPHTIQTATSLLTDDHDGIKALHGLEDTEKYAVQIHSVISSSKMQKKVSSVLRHLQPPSPSTTATTEQGSRDESCKARITILRARASDAGKLVSIAEIVKREIEKAGGGQGKEEGVWYQYILIGEELQERKRDDNMNVKNGSVLVEETVLDNEDGDEEGEGAEEDDFEVMKTRYERAIEGKPLVRGVSIMSLFLSRVSLLELKRRCGEQTNSPPSRGIS